MVVTKTIALLFFSAALLFSGTANSSTIYSVDRTVDVGGVTGSITTDSALGVLSASNIVDWNLLLDNGVETFLLTSANSEVGMRGASVMATATELSFDYSAEPNTWLLFQFERTGSGKSHWCLTTIGCYPYYVERVYIGVPGSGPGSVSASYTSGTVVFATAVPIPAAVWLFGAGLGLLSWFRRGKTAL